jgi:hypothetical protein
MAYVDTMVKPPRNVMRKQEQFGTNRKLVVSPAARVEALRNLVPNIAAPGDVRLRVAAGLRDDAQQSEWLTIEIKMKFRLILINVFTVVGRGTMNRGNAVKKAPMMAKILSKFKR